MHAHCRRPRGVRASMCRGQDSEVHLPGGHGVHQGDRWEPVLPAGELLVRLYASCALLYTLYDIGAIKRSSISCVSFTHCIACLCISKLWQPHFQLPASMVGARHSSPHIARPCRNSPHMHPHATGPPPYMYAYSRRPSGVRAPVC